MGNFNKDPFSAARSNGTFDASEKISIELMTSDRKLKASREGSK